MTDFYDEREPRGKIDGKYKRGSERESERERVVSYNLSKYYDTKDGIQYQISIGKFSLYRLKHEICKGCDIKRYCNVISKIMMHAMR